MPEPPSFLAPYARDEWWSTGPELFRLALLTAVDLMIFSAYCQSYARWRQAEELLLEMAKRDPVTSGLLIKRADGNASQNPMVRIAANAAADMVRYATEFGLSPAARARISAGVGFEPPGGKFDGLLG